MAMIEREAAECAIAELMPSFTTPDGSGVIDEMIFSAQQICAEAIETIHVLPTIDPIRAAGGCRCGECKHRNDHGHCAHPRHEILPTTYPNDFCSYGEAREEQKDG